MPAPAVAAAAGRAAAQASAQATKVAAQTGSGAAVQTGKMAGRASTNAVQAARRGATRAGRRAGKGAAKAGRGAGRGATRAGRGATKAGRGAGRAGSKQAGKAARSAKKTKPSSQRPANRADPRRPDGKRNANDKKGQSAKDKAERARKKNEKRLRDRAQEEARRNNDDGRKKRRPRHSKLGRARYLAGGAAAGGNRQAREAWSGNNKQLTYITADQLAGRAGRRLGRAGGRLGSRLAAGGLRTPGTAVKIAWRITPLGMAKWLQKKAKLNAKKLARRLAIVLVILVVFLGLPLFALFTGDDPAQQAMPAMGALAAADAAALAAAACEGGTGDAVAASESLGPGALSPLEVAALASYGIQRVGGGRPGAQQLAIVTAIAWGESGLDPTEHNPDPPDNSYGLWQINMLGDLGPPRRARFGIQSNDQLFLPKINAIAMGVVSQGGTNWGPWTVYTRGNYRKYLDRVQQPAMQVASMSPSQVDSLVNLVDATVPPDVAAIDEASPGAIAGPCSTGIAATGDLSFPLDPAVYPFEENRYWYVKTHHDYPAADLPVPAGTPVHAVAGGEVTTVHAHAANCTSYQGCGNTCGVGVNVVDASGAEWTYCHGTRTHVAVEDQITAGTLIMDSGNSGHSTGPHLHVGVRVDGESRCPQYLFAGLAEGQPPSVQSLPASGCAHLNSNERTADGL